MIRVFLAAGFLFVYCACTNSSGKSVVTGADSALHPATSSKVLIELFTSQGCSSCPAADKLMGNLIAADTNVIALSFHVDYWDRLGWKDVFSNHDYTLRQAQYVRALHAESLYTPQAIVQGSYEIVGSNRKRVLEAVGKAGKQIPNQVITATATVTGKDVNVNYSISAKQPQQQIVIALVQNTATTSVGKGENAGAKLADYNVVRSLTIQPAQDNSNQQFTLPGDLKQDNASIILFTQNEQTKAVNAVTRLHL